VDTSRARILGVLRNSFPALSTAVLPLSEVPAHRARLPRPERARPVVGRHLAPPLPRPVRPLLLRHPPVPPPVPPLPRRALPLQGVHRVVLAPAVRFPAAAVSSASSAGTSTARRTHVRRIPPIRAASSVAVAAPGPARGAA